MSYLLDAVGREKQQQGQLDPALAAPLAPKRTLPWHYGWPLIGTALGVGLGWLAVSLQPHPEPVEAVAAPELQVVKQVVMPIPVAWEQHVQAAEPQYVYKPREDQIAPEITDAEFKAEVLTQDRQLIDQDNPSAEAKPQVAAPATREVPPTAAKEAEPANAKLLAAFERAVADLELEPEVVTEPEPAPEPEISAESLLNPQASAATVPAEVPKLGSLPWNFQKRLPDINITAHVYSSEVENRWLRANGRELQEGDSVAPGVMLREIRPNEVILEMSGQAFSVPALGQL
ncbi:general secretion pathway protein GspB [Ferrimonas futtsuensis]|uniref:general secretion pathway protein GspB n=1 Tax=Ferrimonas futtsuensis TaxID=364764 RepID=UPI000413E20C|nr:general secretion pathway protein GspB [Ferrimonas futtsuensis]